MAGRFDNRHPVKVSWGFDEVNLKEENRKIDPDKENVRWLTVLIKKIPGEGELGSVLGKRKT